MQNWIAGVLAEAVTDPVFQYAVSGVIISALINFVVGWGIGLQIDVEFARQRAGRASRPIAQLLWISVSNVVFVLSSIAVAASMLKHLLFSGLQA